MAWEYSTHDSYIVAGWDDAYTPKGQDEDLNKTFCVAVSLDDDDEIWFELEQPNHDDECAQWVRLVVTDNEIYCAGLYDYDGDDAHILKLNWFFEFEQIDNNSFGERCFEEPAIQMCSPSYSGIQFYSIPDEFGEWVDISIFDLSGRQIMQYDNLSVEDVLSSGIQGIAQGVYFLNIRCAGQIEYSTLKCIVLD